MKVVSRFEAKLLRCARAIVARPNHDHARAFAKAKMPAPPCLAADAVLLLKDTLAKGITLFLAREGWRRERYLRAEQSRLGRLWERTAPANLGLAFSARSLGLLCGITACDLKTPAPAADGPVSVGDSLFAFLCYRLFRETDLKKPLERVPMIRDNVLCRLFYPEDFPEPARESVDWRMWTHGRGAAIVEALQESLANRWREIENEKALLDNPGRMRTLASGQDAALTGWLHAIGDRRRWDLARFLLRAGGKLLVAGTAARHWTGSLNVNGLTLAERTNLFRAALVLLRHWQRLNDWTHAARAVGYLDEGYGAAQLWKADWESFAGDDLAQRAQEILREIEPLKTGSPS